MSKRLLLVLVSLLLAAVTTPAAAGAHPEPNDVDGDLVLNESDNCREVFNPDQRDADADGLGNRCDPDYDAEGDGVPEAVDNCPGIPNPDQSDANAIADGDGTGDACEADADSDGVVDVRDNCPAASNRFQGDSDRDTEGDACDPDVDADSFANAADNCPDTYNPDQRDGDGDGLGFFCDADDLARGGGTQTGSQVGTPAPGPGGGAPTQGPRSRDTIAPVLAIAPARTRRRSDVEGGMATSTRCSEACAITARLTVDARTARRLRLGAARRTTVASGVASLAATGRTWVFLRMRSATARRVFSRQAGRVSARLTVEAVDEAGNRRTVSEPVTLIR